MDADVPVDAVCRGDTPGEAAGDTAGLRSGVLDDCVLDVDVDVVDVLLALAAVFLSSATSLTNAAETSRLICKAAQRRGLTKYESACHHAHDRQRADRAHIDSHLTRPTYAAPQDA